MSEQNPNDLNPSRLSPGARVRAVADTELAPEHAANVEDAQARIAFERELRDRVAHAMGGAQAPAELRSAIHAMLESESDAGAASPQPAPDPDSVIRTPMGDTRKRAFWSGAKPLIGIAAAAIAALAIYFAIPASPGPRGVSSTPLQAGLLTSFMRGQHERCRVDQDYSATKFTAHDPESAVALARDHLGDVPGLIARGFKHLEQTGFRFVGMGRCAVPGDGHSVHVVFRDADTEPHLVSLFIQVDRHQWRLAEAHCALLRDGLDDHRVVVVWRDDRFLYFLFAPQDDDLRLFRQELGVPDAEGSLLPAG